MLALLLVAACSGVSYCPMNSMAASASGPMSGTHDCCKTGLTGVPPACCHAGIETATTAVSPTSSPLATPAVVSLAWTLPPLGRDVVDLAAVSVHVHSPPSAFLRI